MNRTRFNVGMGELRIGSRKETLQCILGSCIGIAFLWKKGGCCGLAHCLLPEAPPAQAGRGARYISDAIPSLLMMMGAHQADYADIEVVVAGGASMFKTRSPVFQVGQKNVEAALRHLTEHGLNVSFHDLGGHRGRQISVDCEHQQFVVSAIDSHQSDHRHGSH